MCAGCFSWCRLYMPWDAKKKSTETKLKIPEVSANLRCAVSLTHQLYPETGKWTCDCPSNNVCWEFYGAPRWGETPLFSDVHIDSEIGWKLTEHRSNEDRLLCGHRERSSNPLSICSFSDPSSVPERGHYRCAEDYSTMWGSLNFALWNLHDDWLNYSSGSIGRWTKSQRAASKGRQSHDRYRGPRNAQGRRR